MCAQLCISHGAKYHPGRQLMEVWLSWPIVTPPRNWLVDGDVDNFATCFSYTGDVFFLVQAFLGTTPWLENTANHYGNVSQKSKTKVLIPNHAIYAYIYMYEFIYNQKLISGLP